MVTREVHSTKTEYQCETCGKWHHWEQGVRNCEHEHRVEALRAACSHPEPLYYSVYVDTNRHDEGVDHIEVSCVCLKCNKRFGKFDIFEGASPDAEVIYRALQEAIGRALLEANRKEKG